MSTSHTVITGDTFDSIARKEYGTEVSASNIARANPGVVEPLTAGTILVVPDLPGAPKDLQSPAPSERLEEVALRIDGQNFRFWNSIRIVRSIEAMDAIEFNTPFDANLPGFRELFRPFAFNSVVFTVGGTPLFTGTLVSVTPEIDSNRKSLSVSGYSLPGVLSDCTAPASAFPLEFFNQGLKDIAASVVVPFGLSVVFSAEQGAVFDQVALEPAKKVLSFLIELAQQRNLIISSTPDGVLQFDRSTEAGMPVARLQQGDPPLLSVTPVFSPQEYYSHITGIEPTAVGFDGSQFTTKNPHLPGVVRPLTFTIADTLDADVKQATEAKMGRMFGNAVTYSASVATWRDPAGNLWKPNTTITLIAPDAMIYNETEFVIRSIELQRDTKGDVATLNLVLPGAFSGKIPEVLPWD